MPPDVAELLLRHAAATEGWFRDRLDAACGLDQAPAAAVGPVRYSLLAGGKRLRPAVVIEACRAAGGESDRAIAAGAAVELIHTFSLVHDDLPAMDDDATRRGRPTCHVAFGEAAAILAGDAMTAMAFEVLAVEYEPTVAASLVRILARATGPTGMVGGQALDVAAEGHPLDLPALRDVHRRKTGALLVAACEMGAAVAGRRDVPELSAYGRHLGLAFQIADDLLDVTASPEATGKAGGKDAAAGKNTYPALVGVEESRRLAAAEVAAGLDALAGFDRRADGLRALLRFAGDRGR